jgi:hypothetical protein
MALALVWNLIATSVGESALLMLRPLAASPDTHLGGTCHTSALKAWDDLTPL